MIASPMADVGSGSVAMSTAVDESPRHSGRPGPRRSTRRPIGLAIPVLTREATRKVAPIRMLEPPSRERRSGSSVPVAPSVPASSTTSQEPRRIRGLLRTLRSEAAQPASDCHAGGSGWRAVQAANPSETAPTTENTGPVPTVTASVPRIGPSSVPKMAAANTPPRTAPRFSRGATAITQVRPPPQMKPQPVPWTKRSASRVPIWVAKPKAAIETANRSRPISVVRRTPAREAIHAPSSEPGMMPAG